MFKGTPHVGPKNVGLCWPASLQRPLWEVFTFFWLPMSIPFFHTKNNIMSYNISSSSIDHYKKTVAIPLLDSLIIKMQDRLSDEDRHARHLLSLVPSIIVNKALQLDDEVEGMLFWEKDNPFPKSLGIEVLRWKTLW